MFIATHPNFHLANILYFLATLGLGRVGEA